MYWRHRSTEEERRKTTTSRKGLDENRLFIHVFKADGDGEYSLCDGSDQEGQTSERRGTSADGGDSALVVPLEMCTAGKVIEKRDQGG